MVFENDLFQLLEYKPLTAKVHQRPFLMVPPCINKYYILDLQPENSLIRYAVEQGHRTFVMSWRNPDESMAQLGWDDYIEQGPIKAMQVVRRDQRPGRSQRARLLRRRHDHCHRAGRAGCAWRAPGALADAADHAARLQGDRRARRVRRRADGADARGDHRHQTPRGPRLLKGKELATTFSFLRPNDLVWNYVVGNYLKGEAPPAFDLLYWNGDSTNLPGPMYCWYLRHMYLQNELRQPGKLTVCGEKVDLGRIEIPTYIYGSRDDHIVPWTAAYRSAGLLKGKRRFTLGASGHIAGVINPASKNKRSYWTNDKVPATAKAWFDTATEKPGSWWTDWAAWLKTQGGPMVAAPKSAGNRKFKTIEPAPGRYVKQKV